MSELQVVELLILLKKKPVVCNVVATEKKIGVQKKTTKKRKRYMTTSSQRSILESYFALDTTPNAERLQTICVMVGMTCERTRIWFQNRRAKEKRDAKKNRRTSKKTSL